jgi:hypothetical protein
VNQGRKSRREERRERVDIRKKEKGEIEETKLEREIKDKEW